MAARLVLLAVAASLCGSCSDAERANADAQIDIADLMQDYPVVDEATWHGSGTLECRFQSAFWCGSEGCSAADSQTWVRWSPETKTYERCDGKACDRYRALVTYSGAFANIVLPENGLLARLTGPGRVVEIATSMDSVLIRHGQCHGSERPS